MDAEIVDFGTFFSPKPEPPAPFEDESDLEDDEGSALPGKDVPPPPRMAPKGKKRSVVRRAQGLPVYSDLVAAAKAARAEAVLAKQAFELACVRLAAEDFDPASSPEELLHQVAYLSGGKYDLRPWFTAKGYLTAKQARLVLDLCESWSLVADPAAFPPIHRVAAQAPELAQADLDRLAPYLSAQARAALRRSR